MIKLHFILTRIRMSESLATKIETDDLQQSHGLYHFVSLQNAIPIPEYR